MRTSTARISSRSTATCWSPAGSRSAATSSTARARSRAASTPAAATRGRRSASRPRCGPTTSARRSSATWACTSPAAPSRGGSSPSTWAARDGLAAGKDGNVHMADIRLGLIAMVSHLPALMPVAVGCALAFKIRREHARRGRLERRRRDGARRRARGDEPGRRPPAARSCSSCDNNQYAYSTPNRLEFGVDHLADRAAAYGFEGVVVDGTDVLTVYREAHARHREGARGRRPDAARAGDAADGGPRRARRRVLRPARAARGVRPEGPDRALPAMAEGAGVPRRGVATTRSASR